MSDSLNHIAIVMDGNGRWATKHNLSRTKGHREGLEIVKRIVKTVSKLKIPYVTLFTFSTENWKRSEEEVGFLMKLIKTHLRAEFEFYFENRLRVIHIGNLSGLPDDIQTEIKVVEDKTAGFEGTTVFLAINYGGRDEIVRAVKKLNCSELENLDETSFSLFLDTNPAPPVDLFIRTGGEKRLSNFLLWQSAYAELYFSDKLWPEWTEEDLIDAINDFKNRNRRFGKA